MSLCRQKDCDHTDFARGLRSLCRLSVAGGSCIITAPRAFGCVQIQHLIFESFNKSVLKCRSGSQVPCTEACETALVFSDQCGQRDDLGRGLQQVAKAQRPRGGILPLAEGESISREPWGSPTSKCTACAGLMAVDRLNKMVSPVSLTSYEVTTRVCC